MSILFVVSLLALVVVAAIAVAAILLVVVTAGLLLIVIAVAALVAVTRDVFFEGLRLYAIFDRMFTFRIDRSQMQPAESTPAANTRRHAAFRSRSGSVSSVNSMDDTLIYRPTQQQPLQIGARDPSSTTSAASFTLLPGPGASNVRAAGEGLSVGANPGLRNQQNPGPEPAVVALLQSISQLTAMFAAQSASNNTAVSTLSSRLEVQSSAFERQLAANSVVLSVITDRLNHLERNFETRPDPSNHDNRKSAGAPSRPPSPTDPALKPPRPREQSESSAHPADQTCIPKAQQSPTERPFFQTPAVCTPAISSVVCELVATVPADLVWDPADRDTLLKALSRQRFTEAPGLKFRSFLADVELFSSFVTGREIAGNFSSSPGSAAKKPRKSEGPKSLTLSLTSVRFAKVWCRCSDDLSSKVPIVRRSGT